MTDDAQELPGPDTELVARAKAGNLKALDELVRRHHAAVYRTALGILQDGERAQDVAQETFLKAIRGLAGFREEARFRTWLLTIAVNEARGMLRRSGRRNERRLDETPQLAMSEPDHGDRVAASIDVERVRNCLDRLPEKQRLAVGLRVFDGLSFREVGDAIGSSEGSARVNYHHGIRRLRDLLE